MVYLTQTMVGKYAVFAHNRHDVRGDAHRYEIKVGDELAELYAVVFGEGLHQLESYAAAREVRVGVVGAYKLGVEYGHSWWELLILHVMVAHDEVDTQALGIGDFFHCFYTAVEHDDQADSCLLGIVHPFE